MPLNLLQLDKGDGKISRVDFFFKFPLITPLTEDNLISSNFPFPLLISLFSVPNEKSLSEFILNRPGRKNKTRNYSNIRGGKKLEGNTPCINVGVAQD